MKNADDEITPGLGVDENHCIFYNLKTINYPLFGSYEIS